MAASRVGSEIMDLSAETVDKSFSAAWKVHKTPEKHYLLEKSTNNNPEEVIISFPASGAFEDWYSKTRFGETEIDFTLFPSLRGIGKSEPALVNKFFLQRFQEILEKSSLKDEVERAMKKQKQIVFAGHSSGGPVATLATLWALENYLTPKSHGGIHPLCVTFGSPLIGNHILSHATRRGNWSNYFFHFVMRYDIVPRVLLAPLSSFDQRFETVSQLIDPNSKSFMSESCLGRIASTSDFYFYIMSNAATVTNHAACKLMGTTEATLEAEAKQIDPLSPYRPFGTYVFCTTSGNEAKQIVMKNPDAILQVMFFSAQLSSEAETNEVSLKSLHQHLNYGSELQLNLRMQNVVYLDQLEKVPLSEDTNSDSDIATINIALNDLGLSIRARLCIRAAAESEEKQRRTETHPHMAAAKGGSEIMELSAERIEKSFSAAWKVHKTPEKHYLIEMNSKSNPQEVIISFPASGAFKDWYSGTTFGETEIDHTLFPSLRSIGNNEPALVNKSFLQRFQELLAKSALKYEVERAMQKQKQIVFTGHSSGGPVATLATLWALENYLTPKSHGVIHPLCVTFGSPLIGNHILSHATRRENWSNYFFHFVMRYDIVPRVLLAPLSSFDQRFETVSQLIDPNSKSFMSESCLGRIASTSDLYLYVMSNAATVTRQAACKLMGTAEATLETLANFVPFSPYRPFGTYIFGTTSGNEAKQIVMKNPDAILQVLFFSCQLSFEAETDKVSFKSLQQHLIYGTELQKNLVMHNVVFLDQLAKIPLSEHTTSRGDNATINIALNDLGLRTRARLCIQAAAALEEAKWNNEKIIEGQKRFMEEKMNVLNSYRETRGHQKKGYYDAFKDQLDSQDFDANVRRLELAGVWDEIVEKLLNYQLPDEFEGKKEWIEIGTKFRRLVEPLDIANYYRHSRDRDGRGYMDKGGRPKRYRYTQRWLEHAEPERRGEGGYSESCFWAEVEDLCNDNKKSFEDVKGKVLALEEQIRKWSEKDEVGKDVFLKDSTFVKWWKTLPTQHRQQSCIKSLVET